ncbi:hypothetical protein EYF80_007346 [Liparis tanakae]|uniref:Uncharacterized protein n=1 Tax=Liparis tanakae TaxID=230148 RepID=A0A4Z2IXL7_9TELE|nr:hypothetical protein EYF80_007346 [Liparis tanakae]
MHWTMFEERDTAGRCLERKYPSRRSPGNYNYEGRAHPNGSCTEVQGQVYPHMMKMSKTEFKFKVTAQTELESTSLTSHLDRNNLSVRRADGSSGDGLASQPANRSGVPVYKVVWQHQRAQPLTQEDVADCDHCQGVALPPGPQRTTWSVTSYSCE